MFRKNVAGQFLYFQLNKASDGTGLTGATVAVRRCIDGTFAAATGTVTEDTGVGSSPGFYKFALSQADTNGNDIGFAFTATGAIAVEKTLVTTAADPTDSVAFGLSRIDAAISSRSTYAGADTAGTTTLLSRIGAALTITGGKVDVNDKTGFALSAAGVQAIWDALTAALTTAGSIGKLLVDNINATISSRLASASYTAPDNATITAINAKTTNLPATPAATSDIPTAVQNADALLDRNMATGADTGTTTTRTVRQALRFLRNKWTMAGGTLTVFKEDDTATSWTSALTTDAAAVPVVTSDPAG